MITPAWRVLRAKNYSTVGRTVRAQIRYSDSDKVFDLWMDPPKRERQEHNGSPTWISSATENFQFPNDGDVVRTDLTSGTHLIGWAGPHHSRLFGAHRRWPMDDFGHGMSLGEPMSITASQHEGRPGWQVTFAADPQRHTGDETFVIDDESGLAVHWTDGTKWVAVVSFALDDEFDESLFTYTGPWISDADETARMMQSNAEIQARIADIPRSQPTWMPSEISVSATNGDPETHALEMSVSVTAPHVNLRRWLTALPEPKAQSGMWMPESHSISDGTWTHELRWQTAALTVEDAERILRSIPPVGGEDAARGTVARINAEADAGQAELESPGTVGQTGVIYQGPVDVAYSQFYLDPGQEWDGDYWAAFVGQRNGLIGTAEPSMIVLGAGLHTGQITMTVDIENEPPAVDLEAWEEIVEAPLTVVSTLTLMGWGGGGPGLDLPLSPGTYRVRYSANRMDAAREADTGSGIDEYQLTFWPAALTADEIIKQTSDSARYQHDYVRTLVTGESD